MQGAGSWAGCDEVAFCLLGRFLRCLVAVGYKVDILKPLCNCFLEGAVSSVFMVGVGCTSGVVGVASERLSGSCLGD